MSRPVHPPRVLGWLAAVAIPLGIVGGTCLPGCAALTAAAPTLAPLLLEGAEHALQDELDRAEEARRKRDAAQALALLREARAAQAAAEDAARRAVEAQVLARADAERAAEAARRAEEARRDAALVRLRPMLLRLGVTAAPAAPASAAPDAGSPTLVDAGGVP